MPSEPESRPPCARSGEIPETGPSRGQHPAEAARLQNLFIDILHHDLSNPLNAVRSASILMQDQPGLAAELIPLIQRNTAKAQEIVDNARRYVRLENTERLDLAGLDLGEILRHVTADLSPAAAEAGVGIDLAVEGALPVRADPQVELIFANLISNAVKYAGGGKRVVVSARREGPVCRVTVSDFGPGIDHAFKETIFDRFSRRDKAGVKGSGLGLAIARRLATLHGGTVTADDNPGGGALFTVLLPCAPAEPSRGREPA